MEFNVNFLSMVAALQMSQVIFKTAMKQAMDVRPDDELKIGLIPPPPPCRGSLPLLQDPDPHGGPSMGPAHSPSAN